MGCLLIPMSDAGGNQRSMEDEAGRRPYHPPQVQTQSQVRPFSAHNRSILILLLRFLGMKGEHRKKSN